MSALAPYVIGFLVSFVAGAAITAVGEWACVAKDGTRLAIWWHRKSSGHHTMTFFRTPPIIVQCKSCPKEWRL